MGERYLKEYMSRLGWGTGFNLPIANDENRKLEQQLEAIQRKVVECRTSLDDEQRSVDDLKMHTSRSQVLISNMGKMVCTQRGTLEHSRNLNASAVITLENCKRDLKKKRAELENELKRHATNRSALEKRQQTVDRLSTEIEWDQTAIVKLRNSSKEEESDVELMATYFHLDETTIKEGELAYAKMKETRDKLKVKLDAELSQTTSAELMLHRVCNQFREVHKSRNDAVELWKSVIQSLKMRDTDLEVLAEDYVALNQNIRNVAECLQEHDRLLKTTEWNSSELEMQLRSYEKSSATLRQLVATNQSNIKTYRAATNQTQLEVKLTSDEIRKLRKHLESCQEEAQTIQQKEDALRLDLESLRGQHKQFKYGSSSTDEKFRRIGVILDTEEELLYKQEAETERRRLLLRQATTQIVDLKKMVEGLALNKKRKAAQSRATTRLTDSLDFQIEQKRRTFHELDLKLVSLNDKIGNLGFVPDHMDGRPDKILDKLRKLRKEVKTTFRDKTKQESLKGFTESILQRLKKEITQFVEEGQAIALGNENLTILITTFSKDNFGGTKLLQQTKFNFQMTLLTRNRLMESFKKRKQRCYSASKQYLELETAANERRTEIETYFKILEHRKKLLLENKSRLVQHVNDSQSCVRHWKIKYEFVMTAMADSTENGGPSEAFLIVKLAQERECLKRDGELWDRRVKEAEQEVEGLQNTVALLSNCNQTFKISLAPSSKKTSLTEKLYNDFQVLKIRTQRHLNRLLKIVEEKRRDLIQIQSGTQHMRETLLDRRQELNVVYQEITSQKTKIDRASLLTRRILRQFDQIQPGELTHIETEIKVKCLREKYEFSIKTLQRTVETFPKLHPWILNYIKSSNLFGKLATNLEKLLVESIDISQSETGSSVSAKSDRKLSRRSSVMTQVKIIKDRESQRLGSISQGTTTPPAPGQLPLPSHRSSASLSKQARSTETETPSRIEELKPLRSILRKGQSSSVTE